MSNDYSREKRTSNYHYIHLLLLVKLNTQHTEIRHAGVDPQWGCGGGGVAIPHSFWSGVVNFQILNGISNSFKKAHQTLLCKKINLQDIEHNFLFLDKYMYRFTD